MLGLRKEIIKFTKLVRGLLLIGVLLLVGPAWAQQAVGIESAAFCKLQTCLEKGAELAMAKENKAAMELLSTNLDSFPQQQDEATLRLRAEYLYHLGYAAFYECLATPEPQLQQFCSQSLAEADSLISLIDSKNSTLKARILRSRGQCEYFLAENPLDAQDFYEDAYRTWLRATQVDSVELAAVLQCMGQAATRQGEFKRAIDLYRQSMEIREKIFGHQHQKVGKAYWDLGNAYLYSGQLKESATAYQKALEISRASKPDDYRTIGGILNCLSSCYNELGNYQSAVENIREAIAIIGKQNQSFTSEMLNYYSLLAVALANQKKFVEAESALQEMEEICKRNHWTSGPDFAVLCFTKAKVQILEEIDSTIILTSLQRAMQAIDPQTDIQNWAAYPELVKFPRPLLFEQILLEKADFLYRMGTKSPQDLQLIEISLQGFELVIRLEENLRMNYEAQDDKLVQSRQSARYIQPAINCAFSIWRASRNQAFLSRAFQLMEHGKFQLLLEFFRKSRINGTNTIGADARKRLDLLHRRCTELDYLLALPGLSPDSARKYKLESNEKRILQRSLQDSLERSSRLFKTMYGAQSTTSIDSVQKALPLHAALLTYTISDSSLFVMFVQKEHVSMRRLMLPAHFADSVGHWVELCRRPVEEASEIQDFVRLGYLFYQLLLEPELQQAAELDQLLVVPDGILCHLPFEALLMEKQGEDVLTFANLPYLIHRFPIYYAPSATLWYDQQKMDFTKKDLQCLGIAWGANPVHNFAGIRGEIRGLKGTESELNTLASSMIGKYFLAGEATEAIFKKFAPQYDILHLALHARATEADPQILFPAAGDSTEDGILHFHELFPLHLNSRLAVLSACETGTGKLIEGEGVQSMSSGFAAAGVPSVVMSLWEVDDEAGSQIMQGFYEHLSDGDRIDGALQKSKLAYLDNAPGLKNAPYYWSAYVPMGNMAPLQIAKPMSYIWWIFGGLASIFLCILIILRIYLKNRKSI